MGYIYYDRFNDIKAFTTTRSGGESSKPFNSFNQAYHVGDDKNAVLLNRKLLCKELNIPLEMLVLPMQTHTNRICKVDVTNSLSGTFDFESGVNNCDALYTYDKNIALGVFHADCVPLFIYVPSRRLIGIIHAGMEGSLKSISGISLSKIMQQENILPHEIYIHIGPCISFYHYEIDESLKNRILSLENDFSKAIKYINGKTLLDIPMLNVLQIRKLNIPASNITMADLCTYEDKQKFFSYRRDKTTGRHLSVIKLI